MTSWLVIAVLAIVAVSGLTLLIVVRCRNLHLWIWSFGVQEMRRIGKPRRSMPGQPIHVLLCIADHFEPRWGDASDEVAARRVDLWACLYPEQFSSFRDSDGRPPRHTFFYPIDQYDPRDVEGIAALCRSGYGEVEVHLHHDNDTEENLERALIAWTERLAYRHGLLGRWPDGRIAYGFVHGNWALNNSRPDGRWCGVTKELDVLRRTGCYADFTMPSAPDVTQTRKINSIYYAAGDTCKAHDRGVDVGCGTPPNHGLMLIQGPLRLWRPRGFVPRIENGCIQASQPPTMQRLDQWIRAGVSVPSRPDWVFVKLHTHGATESNQGVLLGEPMVKFHAALEARAAAERGFHYHYVTAREMYNLAKSAEAGYNGPVSGGLHGPVGTCRPHNRQVAENLARSLDSTSQCRLANR